MKNCRSCKNIFSESDFYKHPTTRDRLCLDCKQCFKARMVRLNKEKPEWKLGKNLKRKYWKKLNWHQALAEYQRMLSSQLGLCAVCGLPEKKKIKGKVRGLSVDHCHKTGKVRGLLCDSCNVAEGLLKSPEIAESLAKYMRAHR